MKNNSKKREVLKLNNAESNRITRESLSLALIILMNEKPYDKIAITDLVKKAGVSRTAFYRNYSSKDDILKEIGQELSSRLADIFTNPKYENDAYGMFLECFTALKENADIMKLLINAAIPLSREVAKISLIANHLPSSNYEERYYALAGEAAFYKIVATWFTEGMQQTVEQMASLCESIFNSVKVS